MLDIQSNIFCLDKFPGFGMKKISSAYIEKQGNHSTARSSRTGTRYLWSLNRTWGPQRWSEDVHPGLHPRTMEAGCHVQWSLPQHDGLFAILFCCRGMPLRAISIMYPWRRPPLSILKDIFFRTKTIQGHSASKHTVEEANKYRARDEVLKLETESLLHFVNRFWFIYKKFKCILLI